jgi:hypothetical protein
MRKRSRSRAASHKAEASTNAYAGFVVTAGEAVETVSAQSVTPEAFHQRFVAARRPCIIEGLAQELPQGFSLESLRATAGACEVEVEQQPFGSGSKTTMTFESFCSDMTKCYMTTQRDQEAVVSNPLKNAGLPQRLRLSGHLQLANLNTWLGGARATKTPLHVDFHDNFYLLLAGRKSFALFSPDAAAEMQTTGRVARVHGNGLINFEGAPTNADGSTEYALAEKAMQGDDEEAVERALEQMLEWEVEAGKQKQPKSMVGDPAHFCRIGAEEASQKRPMLTVQLREGQALYLPAGWFHQVESHMVEGSAHHWAINWWFHPPDRPDFARPYTHW